MTIFLLALTNQMPVDPASALAAGKAINEVVGTLERLVGKLRAQPDLAALQLSAALDEILKTYYVVNSAFSQYVSLALDEGGLAKGSQKLLAIASGSLRVEVARGRGHCHRIDAIYQRYLKRWFDKALNKEEYADIERAFKRLGDADGEVFDVFESLAKQLGSDANLVVALVQQDRDDEAKRHVLDTYAALMPINRDVSESMRRMLELKNSYDRIAYAN